MPYKLLADFVVFVHFLWIVFLAVGAIWGRKHRAIKYFHLGGLGLAIFLQIMGWYCPLTYPEAWLRERSSRGPAYPGSFIAHYAERLIYIEISTAAIFVMTLILTGLNLWVYLW